MPVSTDHLADDIKELRESHQQIAEAIRNLVHEFGNFRVDVVESLGAMNTSIRVDVAEKLGATNTNLEAFREQHPDLLRQHPVGGWGEARGHARTDLDASRQRTETAQLTAVRVEVAEKFGMINANLEGFRGRTEKALQVATWSISILDPVVLSLLGCGFWISWYAGKLDLRVERVESRLDKEQATVPVLKPR